MHGWMYVWMYVFLILPLSLSAFLPSTEVRSASTLFSFFLPGLGVGWPDLQALSPPVPHHVLVN